LNDSLSAAQPGEQIALDRLAQQPDSL
jgi:hypothetical protein